MKATEENFKLLFGPDAIADRVAELGKQISEDYRGESIYVCCILKGAFIFAADLIRHIDCPARVDFIRLASYGDSTTSSGKVKMNSWMPPRLPTTKRYFSIRRLRMASSVSESVRQW